MPSLLSANGWEYHTPQYHKRDNLSQVADARASPHPPCRLSAQEQPLHRMDLERGSPCAPSEMQLVGYLTK